MTKEKRICKHCGCTDERACIQNNGEPCHWVIEDGKNSVCSACDGSAMEIRTTKEILKSEEAEEYFDIMQDLEASEIPMEENIDAQRLTSWNVTHDHKWVKLEDMIEWIKSRQIDGTMCIAQTDFLKGQKRGEMMMLQKMYDALTSNSKGRGDKS